MQRDVMSTKDLTMKIESSKDDIQKALLSANAQIDEMHGEILSLEKSNENLENTLRAEVFTFLVSC